MTFSMTEKSIFVNRGCMSCKKMDLGDDSYLYLYGATHPVENGSLSSKKKY